MCPGRPAYRRSKDHKGESCRPELKVTGSRNRSGDRVASPDRHGQGYTAVRRVIHFRIPHSMRRLSDNEPGSSGLPTAERHEGPEHAGEAEAGEISEPNAPQDPRDKVKV
jgi:hypothetical protein